jgi:hypothetical protein
MGRQSKSDSKQISRREQEKLAEKKLKSEFSRKAAGRVADDFDMQNESKAKQRAETATLISQWFSLGNTVKRIEDVGESFSSMPWPSTKTSGMRD